MPYDKLLLSLVALYLAVMLISLYFGPQNTKVYSPNMKWHRIPLWGGSVPFIQHKTAYHPFGGDRLFTLWDDIFDTRF